jgi:hypothetical protein
MPQINKTRIKKVLTNYDRRKGVFRKIFGDSHAIKALRELVRTSGEQIDSVPVVNLTAF